MKTSILKLVVLLPVLTVAISCENKLPEEFEEDEIFYYSQGEKIFLLQKTDKIYIKFIPNADRERIRILIGSDASLQPMSDVNLNEDFFNSVILEADKAGKHIPSAVIEYFKTSSEVVSVTYLLQHNETLLGLTDKFTVKLKETTSYSQLQESAEKNNCKIVEENPFVKNQFIITVFKTSELNALQTSNLFFETGIFEFSEPNFDVINAFHLFN